ncbi:unnamed protein product [Boreogadus saida]
MRRDLRGTAAVQLHGVRPRLGARISKEVLLTYVEAGWLTLERLCHREDKSPERGLMCLLLSAALRVAFDNAAPRPALNLGRRHGHYLFCVSLNATYHLPNNGGSTEVAVRNFQ